MLDLSLNQVEDDGAQSLATALRDNQVILLFYQISINTFFMCRHLLN